VDAGCLRPRKDTRLVALFVVDLGKRLRRKVRLKGGHKEDARQRRHKVRSHGAFKWQKERRQDRNAWQYELVVLDRQKSPRKIAQAVVFLTVAGFFSRGAEASHSWLIEHELMSPWCRCAGCHLCVMVGGDLRVYRLRSDAKSLLSKLSQLEKLGERQALLHAS
jgi:hypothetical protein